MTPLPLCVGVIDNTAVRWYRLQREGRGAHPHENRLLRYGVC